MQPTEEDIVESEDIDGDRDMMAGPEEPSYCWIILNHGMEPPMLGTTIQGARGLGGMH
jgi:hypothetical protein